MKKVFYFLFSILLVSNLYGQTWTGTTSTSWNVSTNWSPAVVPTSSSDVIIPGSVVSGNWPVFSGNVTINSINMESGSRLDVNGFTLTLNGVNAYIYFVGATLNNSNGATDIVINLNTGVSGYTTHFSNNTVNDAIIFNITGSASNPFYEGESSPSNNYNGNASFNINDALPFYLCYLFPSQFHGNLTVTRTVAGSNTLFNVGGSITGNFSYTNNAGSSVIMGVTGTKTNIGGTVNISANYPSPNVFEMHHIVNHTTGGIINVQNSAGFYLEKDTLLLASISITGYRNGAYAYLFNNSITGNVTTADDASYTSGYVTYVRNNRITGNTSFSNNGTNSFYDADGSGTGNNYIGDVTYNGAGGPLYIAYGAALQCSGNLTINRTAANITSAFNTGNSTIGGNFSYTNNTSGSTTLGNTVAKTSIGGSINITANYTTPDFFYLTRVTNQTGGGSINVQNSAGFTVSNDTLIVTALSLTGYKTGGYAYLFSNSITGNVTTADDASYTGGYITYIRNNRITGNTSFSNIGTNAFYDADAVSTGNNYIGNVTYNAAGGPVYIAYGAPLQCSGNLTINRTSANITSAFSTGNSTIAGNFSFTNNTAGNTTFGNIGAHTNIGGSVTITANFTSPNSFELTRFINQTGGGSINVQNSAGYFVRNDTLIVNAISLTGYRTGAYAYFFNNTITGNVTSADDVSYTGGYATFFHNNIITGNTSITCNGTNVLYDAEAVSSGNKYIGNVTYIRNGGSISVAAGDFNEITQNLTLNSTSGITFGNLRFNGNTNGVIEQFGTQPISIPTLVMNKTGGAKLTLNDSVTITTTATFTSGNIYSSAGNNLIFPVNISYTGGSAGSHVVGPVTKIGNNAFTFPVGSPTSLNTVAMSAPAEVTGTFRAEYKYQNPSSDGFNTASKAGSFGSAMISKAGYWNVQRLSGATNVTLTFGFGTNPYEQYPVLANLKVGHWSGAQWDDLGNGGTTGTSASGTIINSVPITSFSPFALAGVINTHFYTYSNPGTGPDGTPVKFGGKGGYPPYSTKQLPAGSYTPDSIFLVPNGGTVSFKGRDFYGVEKDDTTITAPIAPTNYITANGNGTVNFTGWRYFVYMKDGSNNIMGAIKDNNLTLGNTTMYTYFSSANYATSLNGNFYLKRSFKITSQFNPVGTSRVRFYILKTEFNNLQAADPTSFPSGINSLTITKYTGPQEDSLFNPIPGGNAVIYPNSAITIVDMGTMYSLDIDVTGFSGFYIGGNNSNLNICPGSTITLPSNISGATYQWQVDPGSGFTNLSNSAPYSGTLTSALTITSAPGSIYGYKYRCVVNGGTFSQTYTVKINVSWLGTASTTWENTANWSCGALPDANTDVIVNGAKPNYPQVNSIANIRTLVVNSGATVTIASGFSLQVNEGVDIKNGATLNNAGTLVLKKNLTNENASPNSIGAGTVICSGIINQVFSGQNIIQLLTVNNAAGITISGNTTVNGTLSLTNGTITLGSNNLSLGVSASIGGTPSASAMIIATGAGQLQKVFSSAVSFTYPVGDATGTPEYSPVTLAFNSGTFGAGSFAGVNLVDAQYPGTTTSFVHRYWNVTQSGITVFACNATFQYVPADVSGTEADIFSFKVDPVLPWTAYNATNTATHQLTVHGLSSFGIFTGNVGDAAVPPAIRSMQDKTIPNGTVACADATQTLMIAGNGTSYLVQNGGSVTHIAGQNILYEPGTKVESGGYMHGYISTTYCSPYAHPLAPSLSDSIEAQQSLPNTTNSFFRIYPNPTADNFNVEILNAGNNKSAEITVYNMQGAKLMEKILSGDLKYQFSLVGKSEGIYLVKVQSGERVEIGKVIKVR